MARIVFMGSPDFARPSLAALAGAHEVAAVFCKPPMKKNRGMREAQCAVHAMADELGLAAETPSRMDDGVAAKIKSLAPDFLVVVAYGMILPERILRIPRLAPLNAHASLLPRWRGAAPIHRAIAAGDKETGITIMRMEAGLDSGDMILQRRETINHDDTAGSLYHRLDDIAAEALVAALDDFENLTPEKQDEGKVTWAHKITPAEAAIDFNASAEVIERRIRAFNPAPGAWCMAGDRRIKIHAAEVVNKNGAAGDYLNPDDKSAPIIACGKNALRLTRLQAAGKKIMGGDDFLKGNTLPLSLAGKD